MLSSASKIILAPEFVSLARLFSICISDHHGAPRKSLQQKRHVHISVYIVSHAEEAATKTRRIGKKQKVAEKKGKIVEKQTSPRSESYSAVHSLVIFLSFSGTAPLT